ncbi:MULTISPECIES: hypothetical protein [Streptomyces]|uniref:hypothetical protein n=1 Tax=Streptomyces TaxID=1883 RepID=UPI0011088523|nr:MULTISPECIES: hypothetical protein [Streptomyces]
MRAALAADGAALPGDDAASALLDSWAYVADVVSFYTERIANEGFLRTATELESVRELARSLGYELRPGVSATADLAFTVEDLPGAPGFADVPAGTPVQSVPAAGQLPQTFETEADLRALACWNSVPLAPTVAQPMRPGTTAIWVRSGATGVRPGAGLLVVGRERLQDPENKRWSYRVIESVTEAPDGHVGWTRLTVNPGLGKREDPSTVAQEEVEVFVFEERASLFGWNASDPGLLCVPGRPSPPGSVGCKDLDPDHPDQEITVTWKHADALAPDQPAEQGRIELDGDHPGLLTGTGDEVATASWLLLESHSSRDLYRVMGVEPGGEARYALSGRLTRVRLDRKTRLDKYDRRRTLVHCVSRLLPARVVPPTDAVQTTELLLARTEPLLPAGRTVLVTGHPHGEAPTGADVGAADLEPSPECFRAVVVECTPTTGMPPEAEPAMKVTLDRATPKLDPRSLRLLANVVGATHGETVREVLGSGDGRLPFPQFRTRRGPLTHVRAQSATGAHPALELRVDGVVWSHTPALDTAAGTDRVYTLRTQEDGEGSLLLGDGIHGARPASGVENITATYRVGIGAEGAVDAGRLSLLTRRPLGIRSVTNPYATRDWAPPEGPADARRNAPQRARALDRAVSVADHEDFAAGYAGVSKARADAVWNGASATVVISVIPAAGDTASSGLLADLRRSLEAARDPATGLEVMAGEKIFFGLAVELRHDPACDQAAVHAAVLAALNETYAPAARGFTEPVTPAGTLLTIRRTPGVLACTMPRLALASDTGTNVPALTAAPARWLPGAPRPSAAQLLTVAPDRIEIGEMQ